MDIKLFDSELKVMDVLKEETGWNMNTTYTLIKRGINKVFDGSANKLFAALVGRKNLSPRESKS